MIKSLSKNELDVYAILEEFVSYLVDATLKLTSNTIKSYVASVRSYLAYYDIDIIPSKFKRKVKMPKLEDEEPLDVSDIRKILLACNNRRLGTLDASKELITSTIVNDFDRNSDIGYVVNSSSSIVVSNDTINQKITNEVQDVIAASAAANPTGKHIEIMCSFGMILDNYKCS